jgi:hypothetical protein
MAETVTISTFLELKDNMSAGLKQVESALERFNKTKQSTQRTADAAARKSERDQQKAARQAERERDRAVKAEEKRQKWLNGIARRSYAQDERLNAKMMQGAKFNALARAREMDRAAKQAKRANAEIAKARLGPVHDPAARAQEQARQAAAAQRAAERIARQQARATDFAMRQEQRRLAQAQRIAQQELRATQRAMAAKTRAAEASARARIAAERRVAREAERAAQREVRAAEAARRARADFVGKAGAAMFGNSVGGIMSAFVGGGMGAAGPLAIIGLIQGAVDGLKYAVSKSYDLVKGFIEKVYELGKEYQISIRRVAGSLVTLGHVPTFEHATEKAKELYGTMRELAAKLPGETKDYMEVFSLALPQALHAGEENLEKFTQKVSSFTAYAQSRAVKDINQVARDMERMIMGKAIGRTRMFNEYLAYMQMATNNLKFGVKEFNALSMPKRLDLMYTVIDKASETFKYMVNDADTLEGTFNSLIDQILIVGGKPLFENMLGILRRINRYLQDNNSALTKAVTIISTELGSALEGAAQVIIEMADGFDGFNGKIKDSLGFVGKLVDELTGAFSLLQRFLDAKDRAKTARREEELEEKRKRYAAMEADPTYQEMRQKLSFGYFPGGTVERIPTQVPERVIPGQYKKLDKLASFYYQTTDPRRVKTGWWDLLGPLFKDQLKRSPDVRIPAQTPEFKPMPVPHLGTGKSGETKESVEALAKKQAIALFKDVKYPRELVTYGLEQRGVSREKIDAWFREATGGRRMEGMDEDTGGGGGGGKKKRGHTPVDRQTTINDFRFSKFDIKQEFAEGFDPDRIAVAFASDLSKLGEMRMQAAYAPLYTAR